MYKNYKDPIKRSDYIKKYNKEWRKNNKEKAKEYSRVYMQKYREENKEKLAAYKSEWHRNNPKKYSESRANYRKTLKSKFSKYKSGAKTRGYDFELSYDDFTKLINSHCHYCGFKSDDGVGIDRINNKVGYIKTNCVSCCKDCNFFKGSRDYKFFIEKCKSISYFVVKDGG